MKRLLIILLLPAFCSAQKITEKKTDDFTHLSVKRTSWDFVVYKFGGSFVFRTRISQIEGSVFLDVKYVCSGSSACIMPEGNVMMLKLSNDSILSFRNTKTVLSCNGCGSTGVAFSERQGLDLTFPTTRDVLQYLSENKLVKVRLYLQDGYVEDSVPSGSSQTMAKQAKLILQP